MISEKRIRKAKQQKMDERGQRIEKFKVWEKSSS